MSRVAYERVFGQSGYDAVARNKIKKLEEKLSGGSGGSGGYPMNIIYQPSISGSGRYQFYDWDRLDKPNPTIVPTDFFLVQINEDGTETYYTVEQAKAFGMPDENDNYILAMLRLKFNGLYDEIQIVPSEKTISALEN